MKFYYKQYKEIVYNFCIHHIYRKHHLHHENITTTETVRAAIIADLQLYDLSFMLLTTNILLLYMQLHETANYNHAITLPSTNY